VTCGLLAFATFVLDTLDVTTRLGRYLHQELFGWRTLAGKTLATLLTLVVPAFLLGLTITGTDGKPVPAYLSIWPVFGASNQLLAALSLLGLFVWLVRREQQRRAIFLVGLPMAFMMTMTLWSLLLTAQKWVTGIGAGSRSVVDPVGLASVCLLTLAVSLIFEGVAVLRRPLDSSAGLEPGLAR
jgi:carbon starvation protein